MKRLKWDILPRNRIARVIQLGLSQTEPALEVMVGVTDAGKQTFRFESGTALLQSSPLTHPSRLYNFPDLKPVLVFFLLSLLQFLPAQTLLPFRQNGLWGYAEKNGKIAIPARFLEARVFQDGVGVVKAATQEKPNGAYGFISPTGRWIVEPVFEAAMEFYEGFILLKSGGKWGLADKKGNWFLTPRFEDAWDYNEGLARVQIAGKWGFVDKNGKWVAPPVFDDAWYFNEVLADSPFTAAKVGIYSGTNWTIRTGLKNFRHTGYFSEGLALVRIPGEGWGLVDKAERFISGDKSVSNK